LSKKVYIILSIGVGILIILSVFFIIKGNMQGKAASNDITNQISSSSPSVESTNSPIPTVDIQQIAANISWIFEGYIVEEHTLNEVTSNKISLNVNGQIFNIGTYPGKAEEVKDFATYDMPANTLSACKSILQTGGDYFYVVRKDNTSLSVMVRFMDDAIERADNTKTVYTEKIVIQIPQPTPETTQPQTT
jgi:hypothetical protein